MTSSDSPKAPIKTRYHHGDLRQALIAATHELLVEQGAENFTLADACRRAGVSTAAPYKHFRDRQEILEEIVEQGFNDLHERSGEAIMKSGPGTLDGIVAMGQAYVAFAVAQPAVFRLMFGQNAALKKAKDVTDSGHECFAGVIDQVALFCAQNKVQGDAKSIALALWTFVHGAACLLIDEDYATIAPELDVDALIKAFGPKLLAG